MSENESENLIEGRKIGKVFKDFWGRTKVRALTDVDFRVRRGVVFGLLGPNGAGKSTLIKLILGHLYPTTGRLTVFGKHPTDVDSKRRLGYVPERAHLYKHLTPVETLRFFGQVLELSGPVIKSRTDQLLDMVGLNQARNRMVGEFSHGMGRRMGLAQALLNDPDLLLLDEPTAGLDPLGCRDVKDLIRTMVARGKTVLLTSHLLADVEDVCDELLIMYGGQVQAFGKSGDLLAQKDRLRIDLPAPDEAVLGKIKNVIGENFDEQEVEFGSPSQSLESYFLGVVRSASQTQETHGAQISKGVAGYLQNPSQAPDVQPTAPAKAEPATEKPKPKTPIPENAASAVDAPAVDAPAPTEARPPLKEIETAPPSTEKASLPPEAKATEVEQPAVPAIEPEPTEEAKSEPETVAAEIKPEEGFWPRPEPVAATATENIDDDDADDENVDQDLLDSLTK